MYRSNETAHFASLLICFKQLTHLFSLSRIAIKLSVPLHVRSICWSSPPSQCQRWTEIAMRGISCCDFDPYYVLSKFAHVKHTKITYMHTYLDALDLCRSRFSEDRHTQARTRMRAHTQTHTHKAATVTLSHTCQRLIRYMHERLCIKGIREYM